MTVFNNTLLLAGAAATGGGYQISRSLRFNSSDSAYLSRTPAAAGNRKTWTWSGWVKLGVPTNYIFLMSASSSGAVDDQLNVATSFGLSFYNGATTAAVNSANLLRDPSAWYHLVAAVDTTQATASNRVKLYINGVQVTSFSASTYPAQNYESSFNANNLQTIGSRAAGGFFSDGYLADIHFIDGQALTPSSFGQTDANGEWQPIAYTGTYGTNGFKLNFADNSAATAAALGKDTSGNGNNWTPNNLSVDAAGFSTTITSSQVWSNYLSPSGSGWDPGRDATKAFDSDLTTFAYVNSASSSEYINFSYPSGISNHGGFIWLRGGNGNGQGLDNMTVTINGLTVSSTARTGTTWNNWFKFPVSGALTSFRITGVYPVLNAVSFWTNYSTIVIDSQAITYGAPAFRDGDSLVDTPTSYGTDTGAGGEVRGNYATLNPLAVNTTTLSNGNLDVVTNNAHTHVRGTIGVTSGKWYWEVVPTGGTTSESDVGIVNASASLSEYIGQNANGWGYYATGNKYNGSGAVTYGASYTLNDVIGVALDADAGTLTFYKNGTTQGQAFSGLTSGPYFPAVSDGGSTNSVNFTVNFGQRPFAYPVSGFKALCDTNLPAPVVAKPSTVMDVKLYSGNNGTQNITGLGFNPDLVWIKCRSFASQHALFDAVRGVTKHLTSNNTDAEYTESAGNGLASLNSDGFSLSGELAVGTGNINTGGQTYAAWCWDAGSSNVVNTQGTITSTVRANPSAGFSIVTYTGNGTNGATVGHGLGVSPSMVIVKSRSGAYEWPVYHSSLSAGNNLFLHLTNAQNSVSGTVTAGGVGGVSSTTFTCTQGVGNINNTNATSVTYVAYCFAPVAGYSSFGVVTATGTSDGGFAYTGFRPRFLLYKNASGIGNWGIYDSARDPENVCDNLLLPSASNAEFTSVEFDFLSNGIKLRYPYTNGHQIVFAAFAEAPFQYARAR